MGKSDEEAAATNNDKSYWYKSRLFSALVGAVVSITVTFIAVKANYDIAEIQEFIQNKSILSNRKMAADELQAKVFDIYVQYIVPVLGEEGKDHRKVALLAGLHGNFSKFFDTRPAFEAFAENIKNPIARYELKRLGGRVARHQAEFIKGHIDGVNIDTTIFLTWNTTLCSDSKGGDHEHGLVEGEGQENRTEHNVKLAGHEFKLWLKKEPIRYYKQDGADSIRKEFPALADDSDTLIDDVSDFVTIAIKFVDDEHHKDGTEEDDHHEAGITMEPFTIEVSYMDTPYMDNFGMRHSSDSGKTNHRMSLRLRDIDTKKTDRGTTHEVKIEILHFEADIYAASQRLDVK